MSLIKFHNWLEKDILALSDWISKHRELTNGGQVSFKNFSTNEATAIIQSGTKQDKFSRETFRKAISSSLYDSDLKFPLDCKSLGENIEKHARKNQGRQSTYVLVTGFYLKGNFHRKWCKVDGNRIDFYKKNNPIPLSFKTFISSRKKALQDEKIEVPDNDLLNSYWVKVTVNARSAREAADKAINTFDIFRAILNFSFNSSRFMGESYGNFQSYEDRVFNGVGTFRFHTLHKPKGDFIAKNIYFVRAWNKPKNIAKINNENEERISIRFDFFLSKLKQNKSINKHARYGLLEYCRALDVPGYQNAFLRLWAVMEYLSGILPGDSHEKIIKRNTYIYNDPELARLFLNHLKQTRNELVHSDVQLGVYEEETYIYQLNRFVCKLLAHYLGKNRFSTKDDLIKFLDHLNIQGSSWDDVIAKKATKYLNKRKLK